MNMISIRYIFAAVFIASVGATVLPEHAKADTLQFSGWSAAMAHYYTYTFTVNINKSTYAPGEAVTTTSSFVSNVCANGYSEGDGGTVTATVNGVTQTIETPYVLVGTGNFTAQNSPGTYNAVFNATGTGYGEPLYAYAYYGLNEYDQWGWMVDTSGPLATGQATIPYNVIATPIASITASPSTVANGAGTTLSWTSSNTDYCERTGVGSNYNGAASGAPYSSGTAIGTTNTAATSALVYNPTVFYLRCHGLNGSYAYSSVSVAITAPTATLTASPASIPYNGSSTLSWSSTNASSCSPTGSWTNSGLLSGSVGVGPLTTTQTYGLQCTGAGGTSSLASATVTVGGAPVNGTCGTANGVSYANGSSSYSPNTQCSSGTPSTTAFPTAGNTVTWTCAGANGGSTSPTCSASQRNVSAPTATLTPAASNVSYGGSTTLTWTTTNATSCTWAGGFTPLTVGSSGSVSTGALYNPSTTFQFASCTGPGGTTANPASATVTADAQPRVLIAASPVRVKAGTASVISWSASGATSCTVTGPNIGGPGVNSRTDYAVGTTTQSVTVTTQSTYTISCTISGPGSPNLQTATVNVVPTFQTY